MVILVQLTLRNWIVLASLLLKEMYNEYNLRVPVSRANRNLFFDCQLSNEPLSPCKGDIPPAHSSHVGTEERVTCDWLPGIEEIWADDLRVSLAQGHWDP